MLRLINKLTGKRTYPMEMELAFNIKNLINGLAEQEVLQIEPFGGYVPTEKVPERVLTVEEPLTFKEDDVVMITPSPVARFLATVGRENSERLLSQEGNLAVIVKHVTAGVYRLSSDIGVIFATDKSLTKIGEL